MGLNIVALLAAIDGHAKATGQFEVAMDHEPKSRPPNGVTCAVWVASMSPGAKFSGLARTSVVVTFTVRVYRPFISEPQDAIDPSVMAAVDALFTAYSGDFTLGDTVFAVDLLGMTGAGMSARAGYLNIDGTMFRTIDINLPIIVTDVYDQAP